MGCDIIKSIGKLSSIDHRARAMLSKIYEQKKAGHAKTRTIYAQLIMYPFSKFTQVTIASQQLK